MTGLDFTWVLVSLVVSGVGFVLLSYGRKLRRTPHLVTGIAFLVYPYFVPQVWLMAAIAAVVLLLLALAVRLGW